MTVGRTLRVDLNWFSAVGSGPIKYMALKEECVDQFRESMQAQEKELKAAFDQYSAEVRRRGTSVRLTDAQLEHLTASYDPGNMTREEYQAFVDDLCEYGVLNEEDKDYVSYGIMTPLTSWSGTCSVSPRLSDPYAPYDSSFSSSGGNVLDWSKYLSTFEQYNENTGSFKRTVSAILFEKIQKVLVKMGA